MFRSPWGESDSPGLVPYELDSDCSMFQDNRVAIMLMTAWHSATYSLR